MMAKLRPCFVPGKMFEFCFAEGKCQYIFGEQKQTFRFFKMGVRGIVPGEIFMNSALLYRRVLVHYLENENVNFPLS